MWDVLWAGYHLFTCCWRITCRWCLALQARRSRLWSPIPLLYFGVWVDLNDTGVGSFLLLCKANIAIFAPKFLHRCLLSQAQLALSTLSPLPCARVDCVSWTCKLHQRRALNDMQPFWTKRHLCRIWTCTSTPCSCHCSWEPTSTTQKLSKSL